jgi:hypothetical protein
MNGPSRSARLWLNAVVVAHLIITAVHGRAHDGARVALSHGANLFVFIVIVAAPVAGIMLAWWSVRVGSWIVGLAMAAALVFGFVNHFVIASPDHVAHVARQWQPLFTTTAVLLVLSEALGSVLAIRLVRERKAMS